MATHKLNTPIRVGDLTNGITVDALELVSVSINFQHPPAGTEFWNGPGSTIKVKGQGAIVSRMLRHPKSGWIHTVTLTGADGDAKWAAIKAAIPDFEKKLLELLAEHLPEGTMA